MDNFEAIILIVLGAGVLAGCVGYGVAELMLRFLGV